jgi:threonyl-tRNA synthetase
VLVLPIADRHVEYAREVERTLADARIRVEVDDRAESIGKKIREGELRKAPYMLVLGDREAEAREVAVRKHREGDEGSQPVDAFAARVQEEVAQKH